MIDKSPELRLGSLSTQDILICKRCGLLLLRDFLEPERWLPLIGTLGLYCPCCMGLLVDLEPESEDSEK